MPRAADRCPDCGAKAGVLDVRTRGGRLLRERACGECGKRYKTVERSLDERVAPCPLCGPPAHDDPSGAPQVVGDGAVFAVHCPACGTIGPRDVCLEVARRKWETRP